MSRQAAAVGLVFEEPPPPLRVVGAAVVALDRSDPPNLDRPAPSRYIAPDSHRAHGTYVKYVVERCGCEPCRKANRDYENRRSHAMHRPDEVWIPYVPAGPARRHLLELQAAGVGHKTVARVTSLSASTVGKILYPSRYRGMATSRRVRAETSRKILAVTLDDVVARAPGGQKIPAGPTWKLLDDLLARGFTKTWIATQLHGHPSPSLQVRRDTVRASTAAKVRELHRRLQGVDAPPRRTRWSDR